MVKIFDDGILEATLLPNNYVFLAWLDNKHGRLQKTLIRGLRIVEKIIKEKRYDGWFTYSEGDHPIMHQIIKKLGAVCFSIDANNNYWFIKKFKGA